MGQAREREEEEAADRVKRGRVAEGAGVGGGAATASGGGGGSGTARAQRPRLATAATLLGGPRGHGAVRDRAHDGGGKDSTAQEQKRRPAGGATVLGWLKGTQGGWRREADGGVRPGFPKAVANRDRRGIRKYGDRAGRHGRVLRRGGNDRRSAKEGEGRGEDGTTRRRDASGHGARRGGQEFPWRQSFAAWGKRSKGGGSTGVGFIEGVWERQGRFGGACELALGRRSRATSAFSWAARNGGWRGCDGRWRRWIVRWESNRERGLARLGVVKVGHGELARGVRGARCHGARCQAVELKDYLRGKQNEKSMFGGESKDVAVECDR
ncbi:hypothetical protein [Oryza sativa Japonica Group]|uniref:Uncharacterized protein n=1 Tax=Oryza sativa subsp. japonica TaxID=39947 RepID=Q5QLG2_ORYSJ|nr:hypothetical protein [Oryza sativa Japonica Group]BAD82148.1 hypothetical protein [Oryza sativa Japonica Group]